jgi:hypothetical protein
MVRLLDGERIGRATEFLIYSVANEVERKTVFPVARSS